MSPISSDPAKTISEAERLRLAVDSLHDYAIYTLDGHGFVATWNSGAERLSGYAANEIVGQHYSRLFTRADQTRGLPAAILAAAKHNGMHETERWQVRKDGSQYWLSGVVQAVRDPGGTPVGFGVVGRDAGARQAAQQTLLEGERRFRLLVESVVDYAICMLDPSGNVVNWNAGAEHIKGYTAAEIVGHHFSRFYTKEDRAAGIPARTLETAKREGRYESDGWRVRKDNSRFWARIVINAIRNESGALIGFANLTRDATEQRRAHEALRESERQFRLLVRNVTDYALYMVDPNGIVTSWNPGAERVKGYVAEEIIGQHFSRFYTEGERLAGVPMRALQAAAEQGNYQEDGWRVRRDGSLFFANAVINSIRDEDGQLVGFAKITRDVSERQQAQKRLRKAQAQLAQSQKLDALGQLTGGVAHDFNNILMIVSGHIHTVKKLLGGDQKGLRAAEAIELAAERGESLTRQLLSFSRRQAVNPVVIRLSEAIDSIRTMLTSSIGGLADLTVHVAAGVWSIEADLHELELAVVNLVLNARDALPQGGSITITAKNAELRAGDTPLELEGEFVALTVADTGCGIPEDILPKVFDPFFTTKQEGKGTGLGLSQVHGFAHQAGGTVAVISEVGKGTSMTVYLPRARSEIRQARMEEERTEQGEGLVLLVEDNPEIAELSTEMIEQLGYRVISVGDTAAALRVLDAEKVALVLSDIVMAGSMNGLDLARMIRARNPQMPVILATGYSSAAHDAGSEFTMLRKPYHLVDLSRVMAAAIARNDGNQGPTNLVDFREAKRDRISKGGPGSNE